MSDEYIIVNKKEYVSLQRRKVALTFIMLATAAIAVGTGFLWTRCVYILRDAERLVEQAKKTEARQRVLEQAFESAWREQQASINLIIHFGEYIKEREAIVGFNKENGPFDGLSPRKKRRLQ